MKTIYVRLHNADDIPVDVLEKLCETISIPDGGLKNRLLLCCGKIASMEQVVNAFSEVMFDVKTTPQATLIAFKQAMLDNDEIGTFVSETAATIKASEEHLTELLGVQKDIVSEYMPELDATSMFIIHICDTPEEANVSLLLVPNNLDVDDIARVLDPENAPERTSPTH